LGYPFSVGYSFNEIRNKQIVFKAEQDTLIEHPFGTMLAMYYLQSPLADQGDDLNALSPVRIMGHIQRGQLVATLCLKDEIADKLREQGELDEAARIKRDVVEGLRRITGRGHPGTIGETVNFANTLSE
jgi:hypothetical protein